MLNIGANIDGSTALFPMIDAPFYWKCSSKFFSRADSGFLAGEVTDLGGTLILHILKVSKNPIKLKKILSFWEGGGGQTPLLCESVISVIRFSQTVVHSTNVFWKLKKTVWIKTHNLTHWEIQEGSHGVQGKWAKITGLAAGNWIILHPPLNSWIYWTT